MNTSGVRIIYGIPLDANGLVSWDDAREICRRNNATMVFIHSSQEQGALHDFLNSQPNRDYVWTGGRAVEGRWNWSDGSAFDAVLDVSRITSR